MIRPHEVDHLGKQ